MKLPVKLKIIIPTAISTAIILILLIVAVPQLNKRKSALLTETGNELLSEYNYVEAVKSFEQALKFNSNNKEAEKALKRTLFESGVHLTASGDYDGAREQYEKLCEYQPSEVNITLLTRIYAALGDNTGVDAKVAYIAQNSDKSTEEIYSEIYNIETVTKATCSSDGEAIYHSIVGENERKITLPKNGVHSWDEGIVVLPVSCKANGEVEYKCVLCGEKKTETVPKDQSHEWQEWETVTESTCALEGEKERVCSICGKNEKETINPTGKHTYELLKVTNERTCTENGEQIVKCFVCGKEQTEVLTAPGHDYGDWIETKKATKYEAGSHYKVCEVCKYKLVEEIARLPYPEIDRLLDNAELNPKITGFEELDKKIDKIFSKIFTSENTISEKVYACYDYLIANYTYAPIDPGKYWDFLIVNPYYYTEKGHNYENSYDGYAVFSAIASLTTKQGTCVEFSNTFAIMMQRIGLPCFTVKCQAQAGNEYSGHTLTFMTLEGNDYIFDTQIEQILAANYGGCYYGRFGKTVDELGTKYKDYTDIEKSRRYFGKYLVDKELMKLLVEMIYAS